MEVRPMDKTMLALVIGLVAGATGSYMTNKLMAPTGDAIGESGGAASVDEERLARIESKLDELRSERAGLSGARPAAEMGDAPVMGSMTVDALVEKLDERMRASMKETLTELSESGGAVSELIEAPASKPKKRVKLADAAMELGLSTAEETALLRTYEEYEDKAIEIIAEDDDEAEEIRTKFKAARKDPMKMLELIAYVPRIIPKAAELGQLRSDREKAIVDAIGEDNAKRLKDEFIVEEAGIFGLGGGDGMNMEVRTGSGRRR